jgi:putative transposase
MCNAAPPKARTPARSAAASSASSPASSTSSWNATTSQPSRSSTWLDRHSSLGLYPDDAALLRLAGMLLIEQNDEWQVAERRYLSEGSMAKLAATGDDAARPKEVRRATAELVAT